MKILRVISSMDPKSGGPCQGIRNSVPELLKLGVINEVVCLNDPDSDFLLNDPFKIHAIGQSKTPWAFHSDLIPWLTENLSRFDVVIIHGLWLYHSFAVARAIREYRIKNKVSSPVVCVMPHGMLDPWFQKAEGRKLKAIRNWIYWKLIESKVIRQAEAILFTSGEELRLARGTFKPYLPKREIDVGYGVLPPPKSDPEAASSLRTKIPALGNAPYLLFLSRIDVKKGVDLLTKAYLLLKQTGYKLPKLVIAGPGKESLYGKEMITLSNSDEDIVFPGMLSGTNKWEAFYGCEAFILPSHQENFGIAVVEALACGKPVLISDQVNIYREILEGKAGIVEHDDPEGVRQLLIKWTSLSDVDKTQMSERARNIYDTYYTIEQAALKLKSSLELLISANG